MSRPTIETVIIGCEEIADDNFRPKINNFISEAETIIKVSLSEFDLVDELITTAPPAIELLWTYKTREIAYTALNRDGFVNAEDGSHKEVLYRTKYDDLLLDIRNGSVKLPIQNGSASDVGSVRFG